MEGWGLGENAGDYTEDMLFAEIHRRIPLLVLGEILLSHRFRTDLRWVGQDPEFSYRLRYRAMLEKEFTDGNFSIIPYLSAELFWDSRYSAITRVRVIGGSTLAWGPYSTSSATIISSAANSGRRAMRCPRRPILPKRASRLMRPWRIYLWVMPKVPIIRRVSLPG